MSKRKKLDILKKLVLYCIERIKVTRPPTPWLETLYVAKHQQEGKRRPFIAHRDNTPESWSKYRELRNKIKSLTKSTNKHFYETTLSSKKT